MKKKIGPRKRILIVEDEPRILRFMSIALVGSGYDIIPATRGDEVIDLVQSEKPDIVLLDIFLPGADGLEVLQELRTFSQLPVIVISARDSLGSNALELGATGFLPKPFKPEQLAKKIRDILGD